MRVWFNKTFSSVHSALRLIREADTAGRYELVASSPNAHALVKLASDKFCDEPAGLTGSAYIDWCEKFCTDHGIGIFVPGKEAALFSESGERFANVGTRILSVASRVNLDLIHDKGRFYGLMSSEAVPAPAWRRCTSAEAFEEAYAELSKTHGALCIKPAVSVYGIGFRRIHEDRSAYAIFSGGHDYQIDLNSLRAMLKLQGTFPALLLMEYLGGHEYSVDCISDRGVLKCAIARRKPRSVGGGQVIDAREDIQAACRKVVSQLEVNGYSNIQFREGARGLRILEINPRMSGGIAMACLAGPNLPYLGLVGFDRGYDEFDPKPVAAGLRVAEFNQSTVLS